MVVEKNYLSIQTQNTNLTMGGVKNVNIITYGFNCYKII